MNTVSKIVTAAAALAALPLAAFASIDDSNNPYARSWSEAAATSAEPTLLNGGTALPKAPSLAGATLTNTSDLQGALVLSENRQLIGSVVSVFETPNGDLVASVAPADRMRTSANRVLIPVTQVNSEGNLQLNANLYDVRSALQHEYGSVQTD